MKELKQDRTLRNVIPPLTSEEYEELEKSIIFEGCREPIVVWNGLIIDGHNRYDICTKNNIPFSTIEKDFASKKEALSWMINNQLGRRNLTPQQRIELVKERYKILGGPDTVSLMKPMAEEAGVSLGTLHKHNVVEEKGSKRVKEDMKKGNLSISKAYEKTTGKSNNPSKPKKPKGTGEPLIETIEAPMVQSLDEPQFAEDEEPCPHCQGTGRRKKKVKAPGECDYPWTHRTRECPICGEMHKTEDGEE